MAGTDTLLISNSGLAWVSGVLDDADPTNADGSPKWINDATVAWTLLDEDALSLGSGTGTAVGSGRYRLDLSHSLNFAEAASLHVVVTTQTGFKADITRPIAPATRTGRTPAT